MSAWKIRGASQLFLLGCFTFLFAAVGLPAQTSSPRHGVPVTVVLVPDLGYGGADAVILRRPSEDPADLILLRAGTESPEQLTEAVLGLLSVRKSQGDLPTGAPRVLRVRALKARSQPVRWTHGVIHNLRTAQARDVRGVGRYRAIDVLLPEQQQRNR